MNAVSSVLVSMRHLCITIAYCIINCSDSWIKTATNNLNLGFMFGLIRKTKGMVVSAWPSHISTAILTIIIIMNCAVVNNPPCDPVPTAWPSGKDVPLLTTGSWYHVITYAGSRIWNAWSFTNSNGTAKCADLHADTVFKISKGFHHSHPMV